MECEMWSGKSECCVECGSVKYTVWSVECKV